MGEQSEPPQGNGLSDNHSNNSDVEMHSDNEENDDLEEISPEEFAKLDSQLDALNSALDDIEQKNDDIHSQLLQLLNANREVRQQLQQSNHAEPNADAPNQ